LLRLQSVIDATGLEMDEYLEIYEIFQENFEELMQDLENGLAANDSEKILHASHTIKGATSNIGFTDLSKIAGDVQNDPGNTELVASAIPKLKEMYGLLNSEVESLAKTPA